MSLGFEKLLNSLKEVSPFQRWGAVVAIVVVMLGGFLWLIYLPKHGEIVLLGQRVAGLSSEVNLNLAKARKLEIIIKEHQEVIQQLDILKSQLPSEAEVEVLLKQVSDLAGRTGLEIKLWKPGARKPNPNGLYVDVPVEMELSGGYHALGAFFDKISNLPRLMNIANLKMGGAKQESSETIIQAGFLATAFSRPIEGLPSTSPPSGGAP